MIRNVAICGFGHDVTEEPSVAKEEHDAPPPKRGPAFNSDFRLSFGKPDLRGMNVTSRMSSILPNTYGAELFLTLDATTNRPLRCELLGGRAFPIKFFRSYVDAVETFIQCSMSYAFPEPGDNREQQSGTQVKSQLIDHCGYVRLLAFPSEICFYMQTIERSFCPPVGNPRRFQLPIGEIDCYGGPDSIVAIDGWMSHVTTRSGRKRIATRE